MRIFRLVLVAALSSACYANLLFRPFNWDGVSGLADSMVSPDFSFHSDKKPSEGDKGLSAISNGEESKKDADASEILAPLPVIEIPEEDEIIENDPVLNQEKLSQGYKSMNRDARFDFHRILHFDAPSPSLLATLNQYPDLDIWHASEESLVIRADPLLYQSLKESSSALLKNFTVIQKNIQDVIDEETFRIQNSVSVQYTEDDPMQWFTQYHDYDSTMKWYESLAKKYENLVEFIPSIGETHEKRKIFAVKIGKKTGKDKKVIWMTSLQHAREWISGAATQYVAHRFITSYSKDAKITELLNEMDIFLVPIMNPDGYEYTWKSNRLWRKNRRNNSIPFSFGVDLNRNWDDHWGLTGSSKSPFSDTYMGPSAASEPEVQALQKAYLGTKNIIAAIDVHAYSQLILWPWGWTRQRYAYDANHKEIGTKMASIIKSIHNKDYIPQTITDLYPASGSSADYYAGDKALKKFGYRPYSFAMELRPDAKSPQGFILDPKEIIPCGDELFPAFVSLMEYARDHPLGGDSLNDSNSVYQ